MTHPDSQLPEQRILKGMADLLKEYSDDRHQQLAAIIATQRSLEHRVAHLAGTLEDMRRSMAGNLERLSDRMYERSDIGDKRYEEYSMRIQDVLVRIAILETDLITIKGIVGELNSEERHGDG